MYFDSESDNEEKLKREVRNVKAEQYEQIEVDGLTRVSIEVQNQNKLTILIPLQCSLKVNRLLAIKKQQSFQNQKQSQCQLIQTEGEFDRTISLQNIKCYDDQNYRDFQVQVDFSQTDPSLQSNSFQYELQELDDLILFPQNINNYNHSTPLYIQLEQLPKLYLLPLYILDFVKLHSQSQSPQDTKVFEAFMMDLRENYKNGLSKQILTLAKMRTIIIRSFMNQLVDQLVPPGLQQDYHFRISKTYRTRYMQSGLPIPPPRVNNSFLEKLFNKPQVKLSYRKYVNKKLGIFLREENVRRVQIFTLQLIVCFKLIKKILFHSLSKYQESKKTFYQQANREDCSRSKQNKQGIWNKKKENRKWKWKREQQNKQNHKKMQPIIQSSTKSSKKPNLDQQFINLKNKYSRIKISRTLRNQQKQESQQAEDETEVQIQHNQSCHIDLLKQKFNKNQRVIKKQKNNNEQHNKINLE